MTRRSKSLILAGIGSLLFGAGWLASATYSEIGSRFADGGDRGGKKLDIYCKNSQPEFCDGIEKEALERGGYRLSTKSDPFFVPDFSIVIDVKSGTKDLIYSVQYEIWRGSPIKGSKVVSANGGFIHGEFPDLAAAEFATIIFNTIDKSEPG